MIDKKLVEKVAHLARLELSDNEKIKMQRELSAILDYMALLNEVDVSNVAPFYANGDLFNITRVDQASSLDEQARQKIIEQFPRQDGAYLKVKEIF
ncbi:MAG: Asp-tRNA(Asn)/Glu-tRNA(Gln) amidotransferase subunit GatC [Patescibacteria group bacterium]